MKTKAILRRDIRASLDRLSQSKKSAQSQLIREALTFPRGTRVALFAGTSREPQLLDLITTRHDLRFFLPKVTGEGTMEMLEVTNLESLTAGAFGILEPSTGQPATALDVILCPGLAFTLTGQRLGQGGGFYDRFLPRFPDSRRIGICFREQILSELPTHPHDCPMHAILTPSSAPAARIQEC